MEITTKNLCLRYSDGEGERTILNDINLSINHQATTILIGPSGSGKSSLIYLLSSLRKPTSGTVSLDNVTITNNKNTEQIRYENFGLIFQQHFLIPYLSVIENICLARKDMDLRREANELLERLNISKISNKKPYQLSGGERQRVAIARALVKNPKVIFADEPTASLRQCYSDLFFTQRTHKG